MCSLCTPSICVWGYLGLWSVLLLLTTLVLCLDWRLWHHATTTCLRSHGNADRPHPAWPPAPRLGLHRPGHLHRWGPRGSEAGVDWQAASRQLQVLLWRVRVGAWAAGAGGGSRLLVGGA